LASEGFRSCSVLESGVSSLNLRFLVLTLILLIRAVEPMVVAYNQAIYLSFSAESRRLMKQIDDVNDPCIAAWTSCRAKSSAKGIQHFQVQV
jgi:hypothetical protein